MFQLDNETAAVLRLNILFPEVVLMLMVFCTCISIVFTFDIQVWISFAQFEKTTGEPEAMKKTRGIYREAADAMKKSEEKEERLMILESWQAFEVC